MGEDYPEVPEDAIPDGWEQRGRSKDRLFDAGTVSVIGRTVLYAHAGVEAALATAGAKRVLGPPPQRDGNGDRLVGIDTVAPFAFVTGLSFRPPLMPGIGPASLLPMILTEARRSFASDFRNRGFEAVDRESRGRIRTTAGKRARLTRYAATYPIESDASTEAVEVEGWLAVRIDEGAFRITGGAYPTSGLAELLAEQEDPPATDPSAFRDTLIDLIRSVG